MLKLIAATSLLVATVSAQSCPPIHVFGARETTAAPGYGTAGVVVNLVLQAYPGSTASAISYPACGGQSSCGGIAYGNSANQGTTAVANAVNQMNQRCPNTQIVLVGYSQGGQITDNAVCGGGDSYSGITNTAVPINSAALNMVKAVIEMGSPRFRAGFSYNVGSCTAQGFAPRPAGFQCPSGNKIKSYCDSADPYCCTGNSQSVHQGYGNVYGQAALTFIKSKLNQSGGGTTPTTTNGGTQPTNGGGSCTNTAVPGDPYGCAQQAGWGNCNQSWMQGYCNQSCNRCSGGGGNTGSCTDTAVPGDPYGCSQQAGWGNCGQSWMQGYCNKSCRRC